MQTATVTESSLEQRKRIAREQSAQFPARLAIARWTSGSDLPHVHIAHQPPLRAAWLAKAQHNFQAWLDNGGFAQHEGGAAPKNGSGPDDWREPHSWVI